MVNFELILYVFMAIAIVLIIKRAFLQSLRIQEEGKLDRTKINSLERTNKSKVEGLFELQIQKMAQNQINPGGSEVSEIVDFLALLKNKGEGAPSTNQGVTWEVLKQQLENPEIKKMILEHKDEALNIISK